jgi:hypothetical protein
MSLKMKKSMQKMLSVLDSDDDNKRECIDKTPKITIATILEQTSQATLEYVLPYMKKGIKEIAERGIVYTNARYPHITSISTTSHASFSTGALANVNGLVSSTFYANGVRVFLQENYSLNAHESLVYVPHTLWGNPRGQSYPLNHFQSLGAGAGNAFVLCDSLADQLVF